ncbi:MAG: hypothetical protein ACK55Z_33245, partial [bacterium]
MCLFFLRGRDSRQTGVYRDAKDGGVILSTCSAPHCDASLRREERTLQQYNGEAATPAGAHSNIPI